MSTRKIVLFGIAGLALISLATWLIAITNGQQQKPSNDVIVCIGADSVLRSPASGICPSGSTQMALAGPDIKKPDTENTKDPLDPNKSTKKSTESDRLAGLEDRISKLENSSLFEVVNKGGNVIFSVAPGSLQVYNEDRVPVAAILATPEGGQFVGRSADGNLSAFIGSYGERAGLRLSEGNVPRLDLLRQTAGNYALRLPSVDGVIAGIGESQAETGALIIGDLGGRKKASMILADGKGTIGIFNGGGKAILSLTEGATGGGLFEIGDANSETMVKMGAKDDRYGVVMAGPKAGFPLIQKSGLPGSYILGCAGGSACRPY